MPRYGSKTYGKSKQTSANTQFEDAYDNTKRPVTRSSPSKANTARSTRSSTTNRNGEALSPVKRRRGGDMDPFSFSSDEDLSPRKRTPAKKESDKKVTVDPFDDLKNSLTNKSRTNQDVHTNVKRSTRASSSSNDIDFLPSPNKQESILKYTKKRVMNGPEEELEIFVKDDIKKTDNVTEENKQEEVTEKVEENEPEEEKSTIEKEREMREQQDLDFWSRILDLEDDPTKSNSEKKTVTKVAVAPKSKARHVNDCQEASTSSNVTEFLPPSPKKFDHTYSRDVKIKGQSSPADHTYSKEKKGSSIAAPSTSSSLDSSQQSIEMGSSQSSLLSSSQMSTESSHLPSSQGSFTADDEFDFDDDSPSSQESINPAVAKLLSKGKRPGVPSTRLLGPKSKKIFNNSPKKSPGKIRYNARSWQRDLSHTDDSSEDTSLSEQRSRQSQPSSSSGIMKPPLPVPAKPTDKMKPPMGGITKQVIYPTRLNHSIVTSLKCHREEKELYTVVKNVKQAHQCQESGESQQFFDDIEYLLDGLSNMEPTSVRCLSIISLASKCSAPSFRVHLRAHGTISKLFRELYDAESDPSLAISTAFLMYMLSRDRLNMDYNRQIIALLIKLLTYKPVDVTSDTSVIQEFRKTLEKVKGIVEKIPDTSAVKRDVEIDKISTNYLAMECLLSLSSRKTTDWLKEELRKLGGLDFVVDTVFEQVLLVEDAKTLSDADISSLKQIERCQRVLENAAFLNTVNQEYLINYNHCSLINSLAQALKVCEAYIEACSSEESILEVGQEDTKGCIVRKCLLSILRVLLNLTHDSEWGCIKVGGQDEMIKTILLCVLQIPQHIPTDQRFDLLVLGLGLLINLMEHSPGNCKALINIKTRFSYDSKPQENSKFNLDGDATALHALTQMYLQREKAAKLAETAPESPSKQDGEWKESQDGMEWITIETEEGQELSADSQKEIKKSINKALIKAGKHMEDSIVASYCALLLGCLLRNNQANVRSVRDILPNNDFACMVEMLKGFLEFMEMTNAAGSSGSKSISKIIEVFELL
ncbi:wings apart-like protein homolog [Antedon mediterranea]|uniref:wings apart-like protein homolog n=1 Tax=Antedon mediterranea TaxID=105859 RepID=UPI003AF4D646